jgi:hypothetical protein
MNDFVVIIADVCGSRKMAADERYEGQLYLKSAIIQINENFKESIEAPFMITRGDEFQGVLKDMKSAFEIMLEFERLLFPLNLRYGMGKGNINKMGSSVTVEMDGPAFHYARTAIMQIKKKKQYISCVMGDESFDLLINNIFSLMHAIKSRWNETNFKRYWKYKELGTFEKVAQYEKVSAQAIWDSMRNMRILEILQAEKDLIVFFNKNVYNI